MIVTDLLHLSRLLLSASIAIAGGRNHQASAPDAEQLQPRQLLEAAEGQQQGGVDIPFLHLLSVKE